MDYVTLILNDLDQKSRYIAFMDDIFIHSSKQAHCKLLEDLLKAMIENELKLSQNKCQLFHTTLTDVGNDFVIRGKSITITPLKSHTEQYRRSLLLTFQRLQKCLWPNELSFFCNSP